MISTAIVDIETSDLEADRGIILCAVINSSIDGYHVYRSDELNKSWKKGLRGDDSSITDKVIKCLNNHDVIVAHNGTGFDVRFLRSRALHWDLPRVPDWKIIDPLKIAWNKFKLRANNLGAIGSFISANTDKTVLDMQVWMDAVLNGTISSMDLIVEHCVKDVELLTEVLEKVKPYVKQLDDRGSAL